MKTLKAMMCTAALFLVGACTVITPEQIRANDEARCASYGFRRGTDAFAKCLQEIDMARRAEIRATLDDPWFYGPRPYYGPRGPWW